MDYNINLQSKNTKIQNIINKISNLPSEGEQIIPHISVNTNGLITAIAGPKFTIQQLAFQPAKTITPNTVNQIAVSISHYIGDDIVISGDNNLISENIKNNISIFGISGTLNTDDEIIEHSNNENAIIDGTITHYTNKRIENIGYEAFCDCSYLSSVNFPKCKSIASYAFYSCTNLTSISFPKCESIDVAAFTFCSKLTEVNFPLCLSIGKSAFYECENLTKINFPKCTYINSYAFSYCGNLTSVVFPMCTSVGENIFSCFSLISADFPICSRTGAFMFAGCFNLAHVNFPKCTYIDFYTFLNCNLSTINLPVCTTLDAAFIMCSRLSSIILGASQVCNLLTSNGFSSTPYTGYSDYFSGIPYIYVPASLVSAYQSATNWVYFSSYFSSIENIKEPNIIKFTINEIEYEAEECMNWLEWAESEYNTIGIFIDNDKVFLDSEHQLYNSNDDLQYYWDIIYSNHSYFPASKNNI